MGMLDRLPAWAASTLIGIGCGSVDPKTSDAASVLDAPLDSPVDAPVLCDPLGKFSEPVPVGGLATSATEISGSLSPNELTMYPWGRIGASTTNDIYVATRTHLTDDFGTPMVLTSIDPNSSSEEADPWITSDGLVLLFVTDREGMGMLMDHIYVATRVSQLADFSAPASLFGIQTPGANDRTPYIASDGDELWFASDRPGGRGGFDVWRATKSPSGGFANPIAITEVSSMAADLFPVLSADKLTIYVSSTRVGGIGGFDVWRAHRSTTADGFGLPEPVNELNTGVGDLVTWLSPDGCRVYLRSDRNGNNDVFVASRSPP
jgi:Tol biopolymer transport system component